MHPFGTNEWRTVFGGTNQIFNLKSGDVATGIDPIITTVGSLVPGEYDVYWIGSLAAGNRFEADLYDGAMPRGVTERGYTVGVEDYIKMNYLRTDGTKDGQHKLVTHHIGTTVPGSISFQVITSGYDDNAPTYGAGYAFAVGYVLKAASPTLTWDTTGGPGNWTAVSWDDGTAGPLVAPSGGEVMVVDSGAVTVSTDIGADPGAAAGLDLNGGSVTISGTGTLPTVAFVNVASGGTLQVDG